MVQTAYLGTITINGNHSRSPYLGITLQQTQPCTILEPLGIDLKQIVLRKKK